MQTRIGSLVESWANIFIGFSLNFAMNWIVLRPMGFTSLTLEKNFEIGLVFTFVSLARSYVLRRWFNGLRWGNK